MLRLWGSSIGVLKKKNIVTGGFNALALYETRVEKIGAANQHKQTCSRNNAGKNNSTADHVVARVIHNGLSQPRKHMLY